MAAAFRSAPINSLHVSPTRTGGVRVEWEDAAAEHEVEISPDQSFSFLHVNKATGHTGIQSDTASLDDHAFRKRLAGLFHLLPEGA